MLEGATPWGHLAPGKQRKPSSSRRKENKQSQDGKALPSAVSPRHLPLAERNSVSGRRRKKAGPLAQREGVFGAERQHVENQHASLVPPYSLYPLTALGFPGGTSGKGAVCQRRRYKRWGFDPGVGKIPWRRAWKPTPVFSTGESHRQRSLAGYGNRVAMSRTKMKWLSTHWQLWNSLLPPHSPALNHKCAYPTHCVHLVVCWTLKLNRFWTELNSPLPENKMIHFAVNVKLLWKIKAINNKKR